jgi:protein arginine kinase activator
MGMICQECNKKPATVHFTKIVNGEKSEFHLCESCAREKGEAMYMQAGYMSPAGFSIQNLLGGLLNYGFPGSIPTGQQTSLRCGTCGLTYAQFSQVGRFGCSDCYRAFSQQLEPLLRRIHGSATHTGKVPRRAGGVIRLKQDIEEMKRNLQRLVEQEKFEEAAVLRDKIKELEQQLRRG